ncbi:MAG: hypothetical protein ACTSVI_04770, partial [Promethearchaeota archaeon]
SLVIPKFKNSSTSSRSIHESMLTGTAALKVISQLSHLIVMLDKLVTLKSHSGDVHGDLSLLININGENVYLAISFPPVFSHLEILI